MEVSVPFCLILGDEDLWLLNITVGKTYLTKCSHSLIFFFARKLTYIDNVKAKNLLGIYQFTSLDIPRKVD